jgi:hypothetical protein
MRKTLVEARGEKRTTGTVDPTELPVATTFPPQARRPTRSGIAPRRRQERPLGIRESMSLRMPSPFVESEISWMDARVH